MVYPDICIVYCRNFGTVYCPIPSKCMELNDKPFFKPKQRESWRERRKRKRFQKSVCKSMNHFCPDCIYHDHNFDGVVYRGTSCKLEVRK